MAPAGSAETSDAVATMDDMPADHTMRADHQQRNVPSPPAASSSAAPESGVVYTCPMHPEVRQPGPGRCPKCGMTLVPIDAGAPATAPSRGSMHHGMSMDGGM